MDDDTLKSEHRRLTRKQRMSKRRFLMHDDSMGNGTMGSGGYGSAPMAPMVMDGTDSANGDIMRADMMDALGPQQCEMTQRVLFDKETRKPIGYRRVRMLAHGSM